MQLLGVGEGKALKSSDPRLGSIIAYPTKLRRIRRVKALIYVINSRFVEATSCCSSLPSGFRTQVLKEGTVPKLNDLL